MRGVDGGFLETYMEYGEKKPQVSATKQLGMCEGLEFQGLVGLSHEH